MAAAPPLMNSTRGMRNAIEQHHPRSRVLLLAGAVVVISHPQQMFRKRRLPTLDINSAREDLYTSTSAVAEPPSAVSTRSVKA